MPTPTIAGMSPITLGTTVLAADDVLPDPGVNIEGFKHSGNPYASAALRLGFAPSVRFRTPFIDVYNILGFKTTKLTAFNFTFRKFTDYLTAAGSVHPQYSLAASATAAARIVGASTDQGGVLYADVQVTPLSVDGTTNPLQSANAALPTLVAEPTLHTLGAVVLNGTKVNGVKRIGFDLGIDLVGERYDGEPYLRNVAETDPNPSISGDHGDPIGLLAALGLTGLAASSNFDVYFRDMTAGLAQATGLRLRMASAVATPGAVSFRRGAITGQGFNILPLSTTTTHPFVLATGQAIPAG